MRCSLVWYYESQCWMGVHSLGPRGWFQCYLFPWWKERWLCCVVSWLLWQNDLFNHVWKILDSPALCLLGLISNVITLFWKSWIGCLWMWNGIVSLQVQKLAFFRLVSRIILRCKWRSQECLKWRFLSRTLIFGLTSLNSLRLLQKLGEGKWQVLILCKKLMLKLYWEISTSFSSKFQIG